MKSDMNDILGLVRSGRLQDATKVIQSRLGLGDDDAGSTGQGPMKDITPRAEALPRPDAPAEPAAKPARARPAGKTGWEGREGPLAYRLYRPANPVPTAPLIVMLHGCTQTPEDFAAGTRMNEAAARIGAHVVWPEQGRGANPNGCWNWFDPGHQGRSGEAAAIAGLAAAVAREVAPGASGVHVAGLSAGGAMAAILGASYPEVFASVGVHSGLPAGSAHYVASAFTAMRTGGAATAALKTPAIVFHGSADRTVAPKNGPAVAAMARGGAKPRRRITDIGGRRVTVTRSCAPGGAVASELWAIDGLGHAWSGGDASGSYADPVGPDATAEMLRFFADVDRG